MTNSEDLEDRLLDAGREDLSYSGTYIEVGKALVVFADWLRAEAASRLYADRPYLAEEFYALADELSPPTEETL